MSTNPVPARTVAAANVLHLNLGTADFAAAQRFYGDVLGLRLKMQSGADDGDWRFHGIAEPVSSCGYFSMTNAGRR